MGPIIDGFSHILPKPFAEELSRRYPTDELRRLAAVEHFYEVDNRVRMLDKYNIDRQVLTLARPSIWIDMPEELILAIARSANDALSAVAGQFPDRFIPVGTLPDLSEDFLPEFDRCIGDLGMAGIQIFSNVGGRPLDDPEFRPFFERAHRTGTPIWIHPQIRVEWPTRFAQDKLFGWPFDTSLALSQLVFSGMMEAYPNLKIITHHMGGMIPFFSERISVVYDAVEMFPEAEFVPLERDPLVYFKMFYGDTVLNGAVHAFECGYKFFGPDHILFATDYPFGPEKGETYLKATLDQVEAAGLPDTEKDGIFGENLQKLIEEG